jgi:hypothetical protein
MGTKSSTHEPLKDIPDPNHVGRQVLFIKIVFTLSFIYLSKKDIDYETYSKHYVNEIW